MNGIFNLENFDQMDDDEILESNIFEENSEFANGSYATNDVSNHISSSNISIPGGDKEQPSKNNYGTREIPVPGGDKEQPNSKPYDQASISIPASTTLREDEYNSALKRLQQSLKEAVEVMGVLSEATIIHKTLEEEQLEYTEAAIGDAILAAYENGPIFEKVSRDDKEEVKKIVQKVRKGVKGTLYDAKIKFYEPNLVARTIVGVIEPTNLAASISQIWTTRLWQVLGVAVVESGNIKEVADALSKKYAEDLGDYKILYAKAPVTIQDIFRAKFNWKNLKDTYFLLVDKKLPKELTEFNKEVAKGVAESDSDKDSKDKKDEKKDKEDK